MIRREVAGGAWGLPGSFLADAAGSRLPLPHSWPITDISAELASPHQLSQPCRLSAIPEEGSCQAQGSARNESAGLAVACALLLWLSLGASLSQISAGKYQAPQLADARVALLLMICRMHSRQLCLLSGLVVTQVHDWQWRPEAK